MKKIPAAGGAATVIAGVAACGGHNAPAATGHGGTTSQPAASGGTTSQSAGSGGTITESAVSALGAHFPGSVTADQFAC